MRYSLLIVVLLNGCAGRTTDEIAAADDARCRSYGAQIGSPAYIQCRTAMETERRADYSRRRAAIIAGS